MISVMAVSLAVLLGHWLLDGARLELGLAVATTAPALFVSAVGLGLLARVRLHFLAYGLLLAVLIVVRGLLAELGAACSSGDAAPHVAAAFSLVPLGFVLGRVLSPLTQGGGLCLCLGWVLGEFAVLAGAVAYLPGLPTGLLFAAAFAGLAELGRGRREHRDDGADRPVGLGWEALPFGFAMGVAWLSLQRVVPAYVTPPLHAGSEVVLSLALPALLVAWPAKVLSDGKVARRVVRGVGFLALGYALWKLAGSLGLYQLSRPYLAVHTEIRQTAVRWGAPVTEWRGWLLVFAGLPAAGLGVVLGTLGKFARAPFVLGLALAFASASWLHWEAALGPQQLIVAAAGVAAVAAVGAWNRWALVLVPAGVMAVALFPIDQRATFETVRRIGEPGVESWSRDVLADVLVFSSGGPEIAALQSRRAYGTTFTDRESLGEVKELLGEPWSKGHEHSLEVEPAAQSDVPPLLARPTEFDDSADADMEAMTDWKYGLRFAGVPAHAGHDPLGPEGSLGRLQRLFARPGPCFIAGVGAELPAADLLDAGLALPAICASPLPMGLRNQRVLFAQSGSKGFGLEVRPQVLRAASVALDGSHSTVVIAPEQSGWPGAGMVFTQESMRRWRALLAPGGRCLAWLDTGSLDARSLAARVAAFGAAFGTQSAAFLEMRGLDAPFLLLLGWADAAGQPDADELLARLPGADRTGRRTRLRSMNDLAAMLILDGEGVRSVTGSSSAHSRSTPRDPGAFSGRGWSAVHALAEHSRQLHTVVTGLRAGEVNVPGPDAESFKAATTQLLKGLRLHSRYTYELSALSGAMLIEVVDDVEWEAFEREVEAYVQAADRAPEHPLLQYALAELLAPLAAVGDSTRFAGVFQAVGAERMQSWRLAALEAHVRREGLQDVEADAALERARLLADWAPQGLTDSPGEDHDH